MLRLLGHIATPDSADVVPNALPTFIHGVKELSASNSAFRRPSFGELVWARNHRHRLASILAMAARWGTTPLDILLRPKEAITPVLFPDDVDLPPAPVQRRCNKAGYPRCVRGVRRLLRLPSSTPLPSLLDICREFVVCSSNFQGNHWELCKEYNSERRRRIASVKARKVAQANTYAMNLLRDIGKSGQRLHRKQAVAAMMRDIRISKAVARSALRVALARMGAYREP